MYLFVLLYGHVSSSDGAEYQTGQWLVHKDLEGKKKSKKLELM